MAVNLWSAIPCSVIIACFVLFFNLHQRSPSITQSQISWDFTTIITLNKVIAPPYLFFREAVLRLQFISHIFCLFVCLSVCLSLHDNNNKSTSGGQWGLAPASGKPPSLFLLLPTNIYFYIFPFSITPNLYLLLNGSICVLLFD